MKITAFQIENVRGFQALPKTELSKTVNIFIGPNNAGKSTLLNCFFMLQREVLVKSDITIGQNEGKIHLFHEGTHGNFIKAFPTMDRLSITLSNYGRRYESANGGQGQSFLQIPQIEPNNLIYPYLSKRKSVDYEDVINESNANSVSGNFTNLYSKIDRLITPQLQPGNRQYIEACHNILGFEISTLAKGRGKQAVYFVHNLEHIPLTAMGEGVANLLGLITDLCVADNRIFLIEEPENDIHPRALKALLKLILEKSNSNQFFISTHSNIVMKYLGGANHARIFNVTNYERDKKRENLFVSKVTEVSEDAEERRQVLEDLGYDFFDFDLWKGWLFLEESSAEVIIRDHLIRWFAKPLQSNLRTFSAGSTSKIETKFEDFDRLFVFLHLEPTYKNRVWVLIDSGSEEAGIIAKMKSKYSKSGWDPNNFFQFEQHDFEMYYPSNFRAEVESILKIADKKKKMDAKKELLDKVKEWIVEDDDRAKKAFKLSANEVIDKLKKINSALKV